MVSRVALDPTSPVAARPVYQQGSTISVTGSRATLQSSASTPAFHPHRVGMKPKDLRDGRRADDRSRHLRSSASSTESTRPMHVNGLRLTVRRPIASSQPGNFGRTEILSRYNVSDRREREI